ncbi:MAG: ATP-binding cassette domain-containing protein [Clostridiales bacterium]|nr:ATP-binding cassette domain-containing protein [Clostridiales bacterium]
MIKLSNINVIFKQKNKEFHGVKNVNLTINKGEVFGIVGPSGAGKSTLVRTINLLQKPTTGEVYINGENITSYKGKALRQERLKIGMIFQHFNLISGATVYDNIVFSLIANKYPKDKMRQRVEELLELVNLKDKIDVYPSSLSGGQKQRVAIARALANNPEILLCDEATSALDLENTEEVIETLRKIKEKSNITIVFITHEMDVAKKLFDRVAVMSNGEIVEINDTYSIFTKPEHEVTKALVSRVLNIEYPKELKILDNEEVLKIYYVGEKAYESVISNLSRDYKVNVNIIHGKIDYIHGKAFGILLIKIQGTTEERENARNYIKDNVYNYEIISKGDVQ